MVFVKESYFTLNNIDNKSKLFIQDLLKHTKRHKANFLLKNIALLVLDMQEYFLNSNSHAHVPSATVIIPRIKRLMELFIDNNLPVILTRHINTKKDANMMSKWWDDIITEDNPLSKITEQLNFSDAIKINKTQYDAFYKTDLEKILRGKGITQLVVTGVMTHLCCETTIRSAFVRGFEVFFPVDTTATYNENFHKATFLNLSHGFSIPILSQEIQGLLKSDW